MKTTFLPWLKFVLCAVLISLAGPALTHYGNIIAADRPVSIVDRACVSENVSNSPDAGS